MLVPTILGVASHNSNKYIFMQQACNDLCAFALLAQCGATGCAPKCTLDQGHDQPPNFFRACQTNGSEPSGRLFLLVSICSIPLFSEQEDRGPVPNLVLPHGSKTAMR